MDSKVRKFGGIPKQLIFRMYYLQIKLTTMKRFYAEVFNTWTLLMTAKLITELKSAGGDEDEIPSEESSDSQESDDSFDDSDSESLVDPARTRVVDPART